MRIKGKLSKDKNHQGIMYRKEVIYHQGKQKQEKVSIESPSLF